MYQIRVTTIEKYRRWKDSVSDFDTEKGFLEALTGVFKGNEYTAIGTAFHSICELGASALNAHIDSAAVVNTDLGEVIFSPDQIREALNYKDGKPQAVHELRLKKVYKTKYGDVSVTGCADVINGLTIHDIKTKYSRVKQQEYFDSCQWRFYLDLFQLDYFEFELFEFKGYDKGKHKLDVSGLELITHEAIPCQRYEGMSEDNERLLNGLLDYIFENNLQDYITI